ncbi:hypothetical protein TNCV_198031 [Trichonephila clavipes]|nr:hypothetical protein TNCV_198031 [Trichonephila clavipes]
MAPIDFLHGENPPTWAGMIEPATLGTESQRHADYAPAGPRSSEPRLRREDWSGKCGLTWLRPDVLEAVSFAWERAR